MAKTVKLTTPLTNEVLAQLEIGDTVLISGVIYTGRDAAHKRLVDLLKEGKPLPFDVAGQIMYYVGPSPAPPGKPIGSAGPTTSYRMDPYTIPLLEQGLKGMIGKGNRGKDVVDALVRHKAVYLAAVGGAAALIARSIKKAEVVAYEDLGAEAIRRLEVEEFPAVVANDITGRDLYQEGIKTYARS